jgi:hypothetical protein
MALEPIVKFFNYGDNTELTNLTTDPTNPSPVKWNVGTVKAGVTSASLLLRVWNNKGGAELCSTMQEVKLLALDSQGGQNESIITEGWLQAKCLSLNDPGFTNLVDGVAGELPIGAQGLDDNISGAINDGTAGATDNFANVELKVAVPEGAVHGVKNFSIAVKYFFV